jgi:hypothetical protein
VGYFDEGHIEFLEYDDLFGVVFFFVEDQCVVGEAVGFLGPFLVLFDPSESMGCYSVLMFLRYSLRFISSVSLRGL